MTSYHHSGRRGCAVVVAVAVAAIAVTGARISPFFLIAGVGVCASAAQVDVQEEDDAQCHPLSKMKGKLDNSWINHLSPETTANRATSQQAVGVKDDGISNTVSRPVFNGHYVPVKPTPLKNPRLVIHAPDVAKILELSDDDVSSAPFLKLFSGDLSSVHGFDETWATPYSLSIMGERYTSNCPFKTGDGYGDGRAISIGEVLVHEGYAEHPAAARYELQLKGSGPTPFCRGADGRAVLRSSVREFLASEAMAALGISTTRALSLIVSDGPDGDTVDRPWYSDGNTRQAVPSMDDPRLLRYSPQQRRKIVADWSLRSKSDPDVMIQEPCAMTTRVSPSFVRVGHFDLYARRVVSARKQGGGGGAHGGFDIKSNEWKELVQLLWHACFREYPKECFVFKETNDVSSAAKCLLRMSMDDLSTMTANWIRVGFAQGNFNADNCLVAGRTMDYGPFGFIDEYHPLFAKWTGSGDHFGFLNQPKAGYANFKVLVESLMPLIEAYDEAGNEAAQNFHSSILLSAEAMFATKVEEMFRVKLGFASNDASADKVWSDLEPLLRSSNVDWTIFWRQLYLILEMFPLSNETKPADYQKMLDLLQGETSPFYKTKDDETRNAEFLRWIEAWRNVLGVASGSNRGDENRTYEKPVSRMRLANPKYILREWMLVDAYTRAVPPVFKSAVFPVAADSGGGDDSTIHELLELVQRPYDEGTVEQDKKYYRRAPDMALNAGGTAFMS